MGDWKNWVALLVFAAFFGITEVLCMAAHKADEEEERQKKEDER